MSKQFDEFLIHNNRINPLRKLENYNTKEKMDKLIRHLEENTKYGINHPFFDSINKEITSKIPVPLLQKIFENKTNQLKKEVNYMYNVDKQKCDEISSLWKNIRHKRTIINQSQQQPPSQQQ